MGNVWWKTFVDVFNGKKTKEDLQKTTKKQEHRREYCKIKCILKAKPSVIDAKERKIKYNRLIYFNRKYWRDHRLKSN